MNAKPNPKLTPFLIAALFAMIGWGIALPAAEGSAAELLEKGIYTEHTVGDLDAAIALYTQVVDDAEANRPHVAQARFRLAMCHLKRGSEAQAREDLEQLIRSFPEQEELVAQAREQLDAARPGLDLAPAPWRDGERLTYRLRLPTSRTMGAVYLKADAVSIDGIQAWQLELRRLVFNTSDNYGVSRVWVDRLTQQPIRSEVRHGILGHADAAYGPDGVEITSGGKVSRIELDHQVYDNEQTLHLLRMLPLEPGYRNRFSFLPTWTGVAHETGVEVTGNERCQVPAGDFDCYAVVLDIGQTQWISTGPERYVVKLEAEGVVFELAQIGRADLGAPAVFGADGFGLSGTLPAGWMIYEHRAPERPDKTTLRFLDPEAAAISAVEVDRCPPGRCPDLHATAERELAGAEQRFDGYALREGSWSERMLGGHPAISFVGDYLRKGEPWVQYRLYTYTDDLRLEFIFRTPKELFTSLQGTFDAIAESLETG